MPGRAQDVSAETQTDIVLRGQRYAKAIGIDLLNGREQELNISLHDDSTVLKGMLVKDFPIIVRLQGILLNADVNGALNI